MRRNPDTAFMVGLLAFIAFDGENSILGLVWLAVWCLIAAIREFGAEQP